MRRDECKNTGRYVKDQEGNLRFLYVATRVQDCQKCGRLIPVGDKFTKRGKVGCRGLYAVCRGCSVRGMPDKDLTFPS